MKKLDGGPAFPNVAWIEEGHYPLYIPGLTKREWFAGLALRCLTDGYIPTDPGREAEAKAECERLARACYQIADAMLAEAAKGGPDAER